MLRSLLLCTLALAGLAACAQDSFNSDAVGNLRVEVNTTGEHPDLDGYTLTVDGVGGGHLDPIDTTSFNGIPIGDYAVSLTGEAGNCTVTNGAFRTHYVPVGTTTEHFDVVCP